MSLTGLRRVCASLLATVVLAPLTACGSSGGDGDSLTYWSMWTENEPQARVLKAAIADFTAETGIEVDVEWQGRTVMEKLAPALTTGKVPDLVDQSDDKLYPTLVHSGRARDLSDVYDRPAAGERAPLKKELETKYLGYLRKQPEGGRRWIMPYEVTSVVLWYNDADKAVRAPRTWDELLDICAALKKKQRACIAAEGDQGLYTAWWFDYLVDRIGGDGTMARAIADPSGAGWDHPAVRQAAAKVQQLVDKGYLIKGYDASKYPEQQNRWAQGKAGFVLNGSWLPSETRRFAADGFRYRAAPFPSVGAQQGERRNATDVRLFGFAIPKQAQNPEGAEKLLAHVMARKQLRKIATQADNITPRPDVPAPRVLRGVKELLESVPAREQLPGSTVEYTEKVVFPAYQDLFFGKTGPDGFLKKLKKLHRAHAKAAN